jgi:hypothetical protein
MITHKSAESQDVQFLRSKMKSKYSLFLLIWVGMIVLTMMACKPKSVFLEANRVELDTSNVELRKVQFFNDKPIILRRKAMESDIRQSGGKMVEVDGERVQEILIKKGTKGVIVGNKNGKLLIAFENGEGKYLRFYKNAKNAYQIDADKWVNRRGMISYADMDFAIEAESNDVLLMFREKKKFKSASEQRTVKGMKVVKGKNK